MGLVKLLCKHSGPQMEWMRRGEGGWKAGLGRKNVYLSGAVKGCHMSVCVNLHCDCKIQPFCSIPQNCRYISFLYHKFQHSKLCGLAVHTNETMKILLVGNLILKLILSMFQLDAPQGVHTNVVVYDLLKLQLRYLP